MAYALAQELGLRQRLISAARLGIAGVGGKIPSLA
jgi:hypothetical protein